MYFIYFDESGNTGLNLSDAQQPVFVLCAILVHKDQWLKLEQELQIAIEEFFPDRPSDFEAHATELRNGKGYFRDFSVTHRIAFRDRWFAIAENFGVKVVYRAIAKIRFKRWIENALEENVQINPHVAAFPLLAQVINEYLESLADSPIGIFISDENAEIMRDLEKSIRELRGYDGSLKLSRIVEKGFFIDSSKSLPLQLCDMFAFTVRKKEEGKVGMPVKDIDAGAISLVDPMIHRGNEYLWDVLNWLAEERRSD